jgi:hypothetical protein
MHNTIPTDIATVGQKKYILTRGQAVCLYDDDASISDAFTFEPNSA